MAGVVAASHHTDQHGRSPTPKLVIDTGHSMTAASLGSATFRMEKLSSHPSTHSAGLAQLPEELIEAIVHYLAPSADRSIYHVRPLQDLSRVSMVSKKLRRIAEPLLYRMIPITVGKLGRQMKVPIESWTEDQLAQGHTRYAKFTIPTDEGCNAKLFIRTLEARSELATLVKTLILMRNDYGMKDRVAMGYYGWESDLKIGKRQIEGAVKTGEPIEADQVAGTRPTVPGRVQDRSNIMAGELLCLLSDITCLDCSHLRTDVNWNVVLDYFAILRRRVPVSQPLEGVKLTKLTLNCNYRSVASMWPLFALPQLKTLHLENLRLEDKLQPGRQLQS